MLDLGKSPHTPTNLSAVGVDEPLHIHTHSTRALVQDSKLRLMIEQPRHLRRGRVYRCSKNPCIM